MSQDEEEMTDMSCSVWVKVETCDPDQHDQDYNPNVDSNTYTQETTATAIPNTVNKAPEKKAQKKKHYIPREKQIQPLSEILECHNCDYKTTIKRNLSIHMRIHSEPLRCQYCEFTFIYERGLKKHLKDAHNQGYEEVKSFACDQCDYKTSFKYNLKTHKRKHKVEKDYKCGLCDFTTSYRHNFVKHSKKHQEREMFKCPHCPFENKFEGFITRHLIQIHKKTIEMANSCKFCGFSNKESWRLRVHQKKSKVNKEICCKMCSFKTYYKCESRLHRQSHYNGDFTINKFIKQHKVCLIDKQEEKIKKKCDCCDFTSDDQIKLAEHIRKNVKNSVIQCDLCAFNSFYACELEMHKNKDHVNEIDRNFDNATRNTANINTTHLENAVNTNVDPSMNLLTTEHNLQPSTSQSQDFVTYNEIMVGKKRCSAQNYLIDRSYVNFKSIPVLKTNDIDKPFQCTFCGYQSKFKACVQRHFQRHHTDNNVKPYVCINCDFAAKTKEQINLHNKRSESNTPVKCSQCNYTALHKCSVKMHEKEHFEFKCDSCSYTCRTKYLLSKHYSTYHLKKDIKCENCDFTEKRNDSVILHETVHTGEKPYKCKFCNYESVRRRVVKEHLKKNHGLGKGFLKSKSYIDPYPPFDGDNDEETSENESDMQNDSNNSNSEMTNVKCEKIPEQSDSGNGQSEPVGKIGTDGLRHDNELNNTENDITDQNVFGSIQNETAINHSVIRREHIIMQNNLPMNSNFNLPIVQNMHNCSVIVPNNGLEFEQNYHHAQKTGQNSHNIPEVQNVSQVVQNYHFRPSIVQNGFMDMQNDRNVINEVQCDQLGFINVQNGQNRMNI